MVKSASMTMMGMAVILIGLAGCGGSGASTPEGVMKESIAQMNEMGALMENAKKASDIKPKMEAVTAKLTELTKKLEGMKVTDAQKKDLEKKLEPELKAALGKMMGGMMKLTITDPEGMKELNKALEKTMPK